MSERFYYKVGEDYELNATPIRTEMATSDTTRPIDKSRDSHKKLSQKRFEAHVILHGRMLSDPHPEPLRPYQDDSLHGLSTKDALKRILAPRLTRLIKHISRTMRRR